jgi:acyl carrier protein
MGTAARRKAERWPIEREPQDDATFLTACGFAPDSPEAAIAFTVRRVIAELGVVKPAEIHAEDRWPEELGTLDFWDSIDLLHFIFSIELAAGAKIPVDEGLRTFFRSGFVVSDLVEHLVGKLVARSGA